MVVDDLEDCEKFVDDKPLRTVTERPSREEHLDGFIRCIIWLQHVFTFTQFLSNVKMCLKRFVDSMRDCTKTAEQLHVLLVGSGADPAFWLTDAIVSTKLQHL